MAMERTIEKQNLKEAKMQFPKNMFYDHALSWVTQQNFWKYSKQLLRKDLQSIAWRIEEAK